MTICWTPSWSLFEGVVWNGIGNRDASINVGSFESSEAGGRQTKCNISAAEVPIYRFSSMIVGG